MSSPGMTQFKTPGGDFLSAWRDIGEATASAMELNGAIDSILEEVASLRFEFATVSLVDNYRRVIETFRGWNVPSGWIKRAKHSLDVDANAAPDAVDIQVDVINKRKTARISGWDNRLDRKIYERFEHERFSRIWVPILDGNEAVGTIEAGCECKRESEVLTEENIRAVERLGRDHGPTIARTRPFVLLELIAQQAVKIVGADSASLHVYQSGRLRLMAGAGAAARDLLGAFSPDRTGVAHVMQSHEPLVLYTSRERTISIELGRAGIRSMAAFPLSLGSNAYGVLSLYFCNDEPQSASGLELGVVFAKQMEVAIRHSLLLKKLSAVTEQAWNLSSFQSVIQSLASGHSLQHVLEEVARNILYMLDADNVTLYQFFQEEQRFSWPPVMKGFFHEPQRMHAPALQDDILWQMVRQGHSRFVPDVHNDQVLMGPGDLAQRSRFVEREKIRSCAALVLRPEKGGEIVGCLFINYSEPTDFSPEKKRVVSALASSAAIAIQTARLHDRVDRDLDRRRKQLQGLRAVDQAIVSSAPVPDLQQVLNMVLENVVKITGAESGQVMLFNRWDNVLEGKARHGFPEDAKLARPKVGEGTIGHVALHGESVMFSDTTDWPREVEGGFVPPGTQVQVAVPMVDSSGLLGVLSIEHSNPEAFTLDDKVLLEDFAVQAVMAVHTVNLYWQLQRQIKPLKALTEIAGRSHDLRSTLAANLRMLLTGVTADQGLGLSRAMLFLTSADRSRLRGEMAIGAQTRQEAEAIWQQVDRKMPKDLGSLLDEASQLEGRIQEGWTDCPLSIAVQRISIPLEKHCGAPAVCAIEGKPFEVADGQADPFRNVLERISHGDPGHAVICVPLVGKEDGSGPAIGVLVCDNRFLLNEREIDPECVRALQTFAAVAAMSIESDRLRKDLIDQQRLNDWREAVLKAEHRLKGRVHNIAAMVSAAHGSLPQMGGAVPVGPIERYLLELEKQIEGVKQTLGEFERFGAPPKPNLCALDLGELLKEISGQARHTDCAVELRRLEPPVLVLGDRHMLTDIFIELIKNAHDAMASNIGRPKRITIVTGLEDLDGKFFIVDFADTGPGIAAANKDLIFAPFHTTKKERGGTGLGLAIVSEYVRAHDGTIKEIGIQGEGARFVLRFPVLQNTQTRGREA